MSSRYNERQAAHLVQILNKFKSDVSHETDMGELLATKKRLSKSLLQGSGLSLVTVDNTAAGLAIGIPAMIFYAFFRGRSQKLISELEAASTHVLALLSLQYGRRAERMPALIEDEL